MAIMLRSYSDYSTLSHHSRIQSEIDVNHYV